MLLAQLLWQLLVEVHTLPSSVPAGLIRLILLNLTHPCKPLSQSVSWQQ